MAEQNIDLPLQKPTKCQGCKYAMLWAGWEFQELDFNGGL